MDRCAADAQCRVGSCCRCQDYAVTELAEVPVTIATLPVIRLSMLAAQPRITSRYDIRSSRRSSSRPHPGYVFKRARICERLIELSARAHLLSLRRRRHGCRLAK
jgi:hypothetical protein